MCPVEHIEFYEQTHHCHIVNQPDVETTLALIGDASGGPGDVVVAGPMISA